MKNYTLKDIAKIAKVSITTVSKALADHPDISNKTKANIIRICDEVNYVPNSIASNLRKNRSNLVGVIISDNANPYYASFLKAVEAELSKYKYFTVVFSTNGDEEKELAFLNELRSMQVAGVIITPTSKKSVDFLRSRHIPFVIAHRYVDINKDNYVIADDEQAGYLATKAILENNTSKEIIFLGNRISFSSVRDRLDGYFRALKEAGIEKNENNVYYDLLTNEDGYVAALGIIKKYKRPYSIVCYSDYIAFGVLKALYEENVEVPREARVVGIDNTSLFTFAHPMLTTVDIPKDKIGIISVSILREVIEAQETGEEPKEKRIILPTALVKNNTC